MRTLLLLVVAATFAVAVPSPGQIEIRETTISFATVDEGRAVLTNRDDFVERMSPFDRAARLKTDRDVSEDEYLNFVGTNVLSWTDAEKEKITAVVEGIRPELESLSLPFPKRVLIIKTTGREEGNAEYTRANAIVLPRADIATSAATSQGAIAHELFHILSRANPDLRDKLYATIGFLKCDEAPFPAELKPRKLTNPDAPRNDHCIRVQVDGKDTWVVPIIFSRSEKYDPSRGGEFFNYLEFRLLVVDRDGSTSAVKPVYDGPTAKLVGSEQVSGFYEQVGRNTGYIIHPEEVLADNFSLLVRQKQDLPSPEIIRKLENVLRAAKAPGVAK